MSWNCRASIGAKPFDAKQPLITNCGILIRKRYVAVIAPHFNVKKKRGDIFCSKNIKRSLLSSETEPCPGCGQTNALQWQKEKAGEEEKKKKKPSPFSPDDMEGASAIMRKDGENCCSRNSFLWEDNLQLGNRPFYVPPSPVIGCHWSCVRGKRLHGSFPDFPGDFLPPLHSESMAFKLTRRGRLS